MLDLLITGGLVIDGTGNPGYYGAVGIEGERVRLFRGALDDVQAHQTLDATGRVICPGFIDMHAHSGLVILSEPRHEPKVRQGVTTEVAVLIGDYPSPRTYGTFLVILAEFVREERWLGLADAIRKMTSFPAQRLGLPERGLLRDGFKADVVVFDGGTVKAPATRREPKQFPVGIEQVIVNGRIVVDQGRHTGVLAGRALRRGRTST